MSAASARPRWHGSTSVVLEGRLLALARAVWLLLAVLGVGLFMVSLPFAYRQLTEACVGDGCAYFQLSPEEMGALQRLGLSARGYAAYQIALSTAGTLAFAGVAFLIFWRRSSEWMALLTSLWLVTLGTMNETSLALAKGQPLLLPLWSFLDQLGWVVLLPLFLFTFPDGRFVPRWTRWIYLAYLGLGLAGILIDSAAGPAVTPNPELAVFGWVAAQLAGVTSQVYRYRRVSTTLERRQTKWVVFGLATTVLIVSLFLAANPPEHLAKLLEHTVLSAALPILPLSLAFSILRYRLWDIDLLVNRALLYATLTGVLVGLYVLIVGSLGAIFHAQGDLLISILATGLIAALFHPLRMRLQGAFNRMLYGQRDDPAEVLAGLGQRLGAAPPLAAIVETITEALRVPYAAISLRGSDEPELETVAEHGRRPGAGSGRSPGDAGPSAELEVFSLVYQSEQLGELRVARRAPGEPFTGADRKLLRSIAFQAAVVVNSLQLADHLQGARQRLVVAREEERRRLRRDLHDGLGPAVAAQLLKLGSARMLLADDPAAADAVLAELEREAGSSMAEVRRLIYGLRPPVLDELGLLGALERAVAEFEQADSQAKGNAGTLALEITLAAPAALPSLPAAVEAAAYRIAQEALTNVVRHARARSCLVRLEVGPELRLEIVDDGIGLTTEAHPGVGLASMRERAVELGGSCRIEARPGGGTRVIARLPIEVEGA